MRLLRILIFDILSLSELLANEVGILDIKWEILKFLHVKMEDCDEVGETQSHLYFQYISPSDILFCVTVKLPVRPVLRHDCKQSVSAVVPLRDRPSLEPGQPSLSGHVFSVTSNNNNLAGGSFL